MKRFRKIHTFGCRLRSINRVRGRVSTPGLSVGTNYSRDLQVGISVVDCGLKSLEGSFSWSLFKHFSVLFLGDF